MIIQTSIVGVLLMMILWAADSYLFMVSLRLMLGLLPAIRSSRFFFGLREVTDGIPRRVDEWLTTWRRRSSAPSLPWIIVIVTTVIIRYVLRLLIMSGRAE